MKASIRFGRTEVSAGFFLVLAVLIYLDTRRLIMLCVLAALLHEIAHLIVIWVAGGRVESIRLTAVGAEIRIDSITEIPYRKQIMIYLSGPVVNLILAFVSSKVGGMVISQELFVFAGINLVLGLFNLLPAKMMDGGNALRVLCLALFGHKTAILEILHFATLIVLVAGSLGLALNYGYNLSLFAVTLWMVTGFFRERHAKFRGLSNSNK